MLASEGPSNGPPQLGVVEVDDRERAAATQLTGRLYAQLSWSRQAQSR